MADAWFNVQTEQAFTAARFYGWPAEVAMGGELWGASPADTIVNPSVRRTLRAALAATHRLEMNVNHAPLDYPLPEMPLPPFPPLEDDYRQDPARALPAHLRGDGPCSNCGTLDNIVWFTDSVFWNAVVREEPRLTDSAEILCIPCFVIMADQRGYRCNWRLTPEWHWETKAEAAVRRGSAGEVVSPDPAGLCQAFAEDPAPAGDVYRCGLPAGHAPASEGWPHETDRNVLFRVVRA